MMIQPPKLETPRWVQELEEEVRYLVASGRFDEVGPKVRDAAERHQQTPWEVTRQIEAQALALGYVRGIPQVDQVELDGS